MRPEHYAALAPAEKARWDYREGAGCQDSNPYDKETRPVEFDLYAWEMHKIWAEGFKADNQLAASTAMEMKSSGREYPG